MSASEPSQRQLRVGETVRHALAEILARGDVRDPELTGHVVTVPEVRMSPDLKIATVLVMPLGGGDREAVVRALAREKPNLRHHLAKKVRLKFMPDLRFIIDTRYDDADRISAILDSEQVRRDLDNGTE